MFKGTTVEALTLLLVDEHFGHIETPAQKLVGEKIIFFCRFPQVKKWHYYNVYLENRHLDGAWETQVMLVSFSNILAALLVL